MPDPLDQPSAALKVPAVKPPHIPAWRQAGLRYHTYGWFLRQKFGCRVHKVSLDGGFTCPNVDGTVALGGCVFCDNRSFSPSRRLPRRSIAGQLALGIDRLTRRYAAQRFIAYFQPGTNTYAPVARLRPLFEQALEHPQVIGLAIGTRPDCVPEPVLDLITELARRTYVCLELGLQTIHDRSLDWMNRGHHYDAFLDAMARSRGRGYDVCAHVILGLPGESREDMLATAAELARLDVHAVKLHNLYAVHHTPLADDVAAGRVRLLELEEYVPLVVDFIERLPPHCVIERTFGDAPPEMLLAPRWCLDRPAVRKAIEAEFARRNTWQGRTCNTADTYSPQLAERISL
jgi:radical SAM protein (TIGR01212 family)